MAGKAVQSGKTGQTGNRGGRAAESCCGTGNAAETVRTSAETVHGEEYRPLRKGNIGAAMPALGCRSCVGRAHAGDVQAAQLFK